MTYINFKWKTPKLLLLSEITGKAIRRKKPLKNVENRKRLRKLKDKMRRLKRFVFKLKRPREFLEKSSSLMSLLCIKFSRFLQNALNRSHTMPFYLPWSLREILLSSIRIMLMITRGHTRWITRTALWLKTRYARSTPTLHFDLCSDALYFSSSY